MLKSELTLVRRLVRQDLEEEQYSHSTELKANS